MQKLSTRSLLLQLILFFPFADLAVPESLLGQDKQHLSLFFASSLQHSLSVYNFSAPVCQWKGVTCSSSNSSAYSARITGLLLEGLKLEGNILSETIGKLDALTRFSLYDNLMSGSVPSDLWSLSNLRYLSLSRNKFSGEISAEVGGLLQLRRLDLSANRFTGKIPVQIGKLSNLRYLYLGGNALTGLIPSELSNCVSLTVIDLSSNGLNGTISQSLATLPNLIFLNLSHNALKGDLAFDPFAISRLKVLDLSSNSISGSLASLETLSSFLDTLILSDNGFTGAVPRLMQLRLLNVKNNNLSGPMPTSLSPYLVLLDLSGNRFQGSIPSEIGTLSSLESLDLSSNKFTGSISESLGQLTSLRSLDLSRNPFATSLPSAISKLHRLEYLKVSSCHLVGTFPESIVQLTELQNLDLSDNSLNGTIPQNITALRSLRFLDLHSNSFSGNVSFAFELTSLKHLNLSNNKWIGCLPSELVTEFGLGAFGGSSPCEPLPANITINRVTASKHFPIHLIALIGIAVGIVVAVCAFFAFALMCRTRKENWIAKRKSPFRDETFISGPFSFETDSGTWVANVKDPGSVPVTMFEKPLLNITFADLLQATSNFSNETLLSEGGFGPVYRALLPGGMHVAIKVLIEGRVPTDHEAGAEFGILSRIKHPNLVPLLGYCLVGDERLVIYEYMENGGLHRWLHDYPLGMTLDDWSRDTWEDCEGEEEAPDEILTWPRRRNIALGTARALAFLHHGYSTQLVHRDVKASNVMLDSEFEPHLANAGLAGIVAASDEGLFAGGTPGYLPPEYGQMSCKVSTKGDVYGFGIVLLELVTGKKPVGDFYDEEYTGNLVGWVRKLMKEKKGYMALDPRLVRGEPVTQMLEALRIGYLCTQESPAKRPAMQQVIGLLKDLEPNYMTSP